MLKEGKKSIAINGPEQENEEEERIIEWECKHGCDLTPWKKFTSLAGIRPKTLDDLPLVDVGRALHHSVKHDDSEEIIGMQFDRTNLTFQTLREAIVEKNFDIQEPSGHSLN